MPFLVLGVLEERLRVCWASQEAQWHTIDTNLDVCGEISMFKRQAEMNYATKYKSLPAYGMQSSKALMKVSTIYDRILFDPLKSGKETDGFHVMKTHF